MTDKRTLQETLRHLLPDRARLLLAVSGGADSVALFRASLLIAEEKSLSLAIAHVDHGLRSSSVGDAEFVSSLAEEYSIPFFLKRLSPIPDDRGVEAWAREQRYQFFENVLNQEGYQYLVSAHHADDLAETVLMRFLANREPSSIHARDERRRLLRPFLEVRRRELIDFLQEVSQPFVEDPTNQDLSILRNLYRQRLIPFLAEQLSSDVTAILAERGQSLEDDATALEMEATEKLKRLTSPFGTRAWLVSLRGELDRSPRALQWRLIERVLAAQYKHFFGRRVSLRVLEFLYSGELAIEIPGGRRIQRQGGGLLFNDVK